MYVVDPTGRDAMLDATAMDLANSVKDLPQDLLF